MQFSERVYYLLVSLVPILSDCDIKAIHLEDYLQHVELHWLIVCYQAFQRLLCRYMGRFLRLFWFWAFRVAHFIKAAIHISFTLLLFFLCLHRMSILEWKLRDFFHFAHGMHLFNRTLFIWVLLLRGRERTNLFLPFLLWLRFNQRGSLVLYIGLRVFVNIRERCLRSMNRFWQVRVMLPNLIVELLRTQSSKHFDPVNFFHQFLDFFSERTLSFTGI